MPDRYRSLRRGVLVAWCSVVALVMIAPGAGAQEPESTDQTDSSETTESEARGGIDVVQVEHAHPVALLQ